MADQVSDAPHPEPDGAVVQPRADAPFVPSGASPAPPDGVTRPLVIDQAALDRLVWRVLWKVVAVGLLTAAGLLVAYQARHLLALLVVSAFFALAIIPGVAALQRRFGWRRGAAVGVIYLTGVLGAGLMVAVLIPAIVRFGQALGDSAGGWVAQLNTLGSELLGVPILDPQTGAVLGDAARAALVTWGDDVLGMVSSGIGLAFDLLTIASFTFYIAADYPRLERALMSRMPPARQQRLGWISDISIDQTGGYFYSRLLLMLVNGTLALAVMLMLGLPLVFALPMAVFMGFFSEFIPVIGTFIGAAIPIVVTLAVRGVGAALVLLVWVTVYQQIENLVLSPRLSARTMELNGAVAFGSALAGGAIAGPMGAFMALPVAAMVTAVVKNSGRTYQVVYRLKHDLEGEPPPVAVREDGSAGAEVET
ncbi:AI-2E family transporter [Isoptericola sp. b441]|uniref:AI-2E family transporter n=1 Tax=Actinotalea lenta TaxID=3064654 RepID=A0ABT9D6X7_9CELL|nr:AI-2E family transporter [Isoptericola sp. b441]MDO8106146.1 AI-2E family transporter [Isoptericola sp. b441]